MIKSLHLMAEIVLKDTDLVVGEPYFKAWVNKEFDAKVNHALECAGINQDSIISISWMPGDYGPLSRKCIVSYHARTASVPPVAVGA